VKESILVIKSKEIIYHDSKKNSHRLFYIIIIIVLLSPFIFSQESQDLAEGNLIQFNDNGV